MGLFAMQVRAAPLALLALCSLAVCASAKENRTSLLDDIRKYDTCVLKSTYSYSNVDYYPPATRDKLKTTCDNQKFGFKCLKEQTKGAEPLVRRGLLTLVGTRSRQHKRICANMDAEFPIKFVAGAKCLQDNNLAELKASDTEFNNNMAAILQRNYNNSKPELEQICCTLYRLKKGIIDVGAKDCSAHQEAVDEIANSIVTSDLTLICEDDTKQEKLCPTLEKLQYRRGVGLKIKPGAGLALYLISTLGEPDTSELQTR